MADDSTKTLSKKERKDKKRKHAEAEDPAAPVSDEPKSKKKKKSKLVEEVETVECSYSHLSNVRVLIFSKLSNLHVRRNKNQRKRIQPRMVRAIAYIHLSL